MSILGGLLSAVIGYLLGNFQTGLFVAWLTAKIDLRRFGSGGTGATNSLRVLGRASAGLTLLGDYLKGLAATGIGLWIGGWAGGILAALFVVVGHIWPVLFGFRGGKGVATSLGALTLLTPLYTLVIIIVGVSVIALTRFVSLASIMAACVYFLLGFITSVVRGDWLLLGLSIVLPAIVIFAHRENLARLRDGTENRFDPSTLKKKK